MDLGSESRKITFEAATFRYQRRRRPVLDRLDLVIPAGRSILLGHNGAGKSTLLSVAASVLPLDRGRVRVGELTPKRSRSRARYRRQVAWMPQTVQPVSGLTAREQVALHGWLAGMARREAWDGALEALARVQLAEHADRKASRLSGGQRARVGVAQALVKQAGVLLLDEPTASLDPDQTDAFGTLLDEVAEGRTIVVSTHDVSDLATSYEHVIVLERGRVCYQGDASDFLARGGDDRSPVVAYRSVTSVR